METFKKILVFNEIVKGYAQKGKTVNGMIVIENNGYDCKCKATITNALTMPNRTWWIALKLDSEMKVIPLTNFNEIFMVNNVNKDSKIEALLLIMEEKAHAVAYASSLGKAYNVASSEQAIIKLEEVVSSAQQTSQPYYRQIREELSAVFNNYPPYISLIKAIKNSYWVKVERGLAYYAVGIIIKDDKPTHICYAIPERFVNKPDKAFNFLATDTKGYFVLYQDADNGKNVNYQP
ncbi:MAG: hypothetical protein RR054_03440 [Clostridia bacterium]